ncbi:MAG TPA: cell wall hydrolase [Afifellaceae bacterium]|nr:cell wall hydrolase [Afifellaceae bacterium]
MTGVRRLAAAFTAALAASLAMADADAKPVPRERPAAAIPAARPAPNPGAGPQVMLPRPKPAPEPSDAEVATGSLGEDSGAARHAREALCLAKAIYFEARSEPIEGQLAVARVVLNRAASRHYPDTICGVVFEGSALRDRCQFSFACDGQPDEPEDQAAWALARGMAEALLMAEQPLLSRRVLRATHYHADYVAPWWAPKLKHAGQVGRHIFYIGRRSEAARHASAIDAAAN